MKRLWIPILLAFVILLMLATLPALKLILHTPSAVLTPIAENSKDKSENRPSKVPISKISRWMQLAVLAAEDHRFYEHHGIDSLGIIRAGIDNLKAMRMIEGASTITQQLAKITFLDQDEKTARRKLSQIVIAVELEQKYTKAQILEAYLNTVYFGRGAYGIASAARRYFGIEPSKLTVAQSAFLAGVVKAPSFLGDQNNLPQAITRQRQVIYNMCEYNYISDNQAKQAVHEKLLFHDNKS